MSKSERSLPCLALLSTLALACGPSVPLPSGDGSDTSSGSSSDDSGPVVTTTPPPPATTGPTTTTLVTTGTMDTSTGLDTADSSTSVTFIEDPDGGCFYAPGTSSLCFDCDIFGQDCPLGEKCMPWANDGGSYWNATRCSPLAVGPAAPGEPCTVEGNAVSGIDSCEFGALCWDVDPETNEGTCISMCMGDEDNLVCPSTTSCLVAFDESLVVCLPVCDPLGNDCGPSERCVPTAEGFGCYPGADPGSPAGGPCEFYGVCDAGLTCQAPDVVSPSCDLGSLGCCTPWCDLSAPDPTAGCFDPAQQCVSFWGADPAPAGLEDVGLCAVMAP